MERVTAGEESMRRAMINDGLDPTDPKHRAAYADTVTGSLVKMSGELDRIGRHLTAPVLWLLGKITHHREGFE